MASTNDNPVKTLSAQEREVAMLLGSLTRADGVRNLRRISVFNLRAGIEAIQEAYGGRLVIIAPHKAGDPVEFIYEGLNTRR